MKTNIIMKKLFTLLFAAVFSFSSMLAYTCRPEMVTDLSYYQPAYTEQNAMYVAYRRVPSAYNPWATYGAWLYAPYEIGASYMDVHSESTQGLDQYTVCVGDVYFIDLQAIKIGTWRINPCSDDCIDEWWYYYPEGYDHLNCLEAAVLGSSVSKNNEEYDSGVETIYSVEGYVTKIETPWSDKYGNISFWMADEPNCDVEDWEKVILAYRAYSGGDPDYLPSVGDKVQVIGNLTKYNTHAQIKAGCEYYCIECGGNVNDYTHLNSCVEAANAAMSVSQNNELYNNGQMYCVDGYVTKIQTAWSAQYRNLSFWIGDTKGGGNVIEAFRAKCISEDDAPKVGDKVTVYGALTKYNSIPEFAAGCEYVIHNSEDIDRITNDITSPRKILHDGQVFIQRGDKLYTLQGQEVK